MYAHVNAFPRTLNLHKNCYKTSGKLEESDRKSIIRECTSLVCTVKVLKFQVDSRMLIIVYYLKFMNTYLYTNFLSTTETEKFSFNCISYNSQNKSYILWLTIIQNRSFGGVCKFSNFCINIQMTTERCAIIVIKMPSTNTKCD